MSRKEMRRKKRQVFSPHEISFNIFEGRRPGIFEMYFFWKQVVNVTCEYEYDYKEYDRHTKTIAKS